MKKVIGPGPRAPTDNFIERPPALFYEIVARAQKLKKNVFFFGNIDLNFIQSQR